MNSKDYFIRTFVIAFVFLLVNRLILQFLDGIDTITMNFTIKTLITVFCTALILGILNYFFKINPLNKKNKPQNTK